jgi:hypothetical protein
MLRVVQEGILIVTSTNTLNGHRLCPFCSRRKRFFGWIESRVEEGVYQG